MMTPTYHILCSIFYSICIVLYCIVLYNTGGGERGNAKFALVVVCSSSGVGVKALQGPRVKKDLINPLPVTD